MTFKSLTTAAALALSAIFTAQAADARLVIHCNRGPIPSNPMINGHYETFVDSLMENFVMTEREAERIARSAATWAPWAISITWWISPTRPPRATSASSKARSPDTGVAPGPQKAPRNRPNLGRI